jgi:hypothetical protein
MSNGSDNIFFWIGSGGEYGRRRVVPRPHGAQIEGPGPWPLVRILNVPGRDCIGQFVAGTSSDAEMSIGLSGTVVWRTLGSGRIVVGGVGGAGACVLHGRDVLLPLSLDVEQRVSLPDGIHSEVI